MNFSHHLTVDSFAKIFNNENIRPVLQLLAYKESGNGYRLKLSDGSSFYSGCLVDNKLKSKVKNELDRFAILKLNEFYIEVNQGRKIIYITDLDQCVKGSFVGECIGNPNDFFSSDLNNSFNQPSTSKGMSSNRLDQSLSNKRSNPIEELDQYSTKKICNGSGDSLEKSTYLSSFTKFDKLSTLKIDSIVDIIAVCFKVEDATEFKYRVSGDFGLKRNVHLVDDTKNSIVMTFWNEFVNYDIKKDDVLVLKRIKLTNFNGLSLSSLKNTIVQINPDLDQVNHLRTWYLNNKKSLFSKNQNGGPATLSLDRNLSQIDLANIKMQKKPLITETKAIISKIISANVYKACDTCNKKLTNICGEDIQYQCSKCGYILDYKWSILLTLCIIDHTNEIMVKMFSKECERILGDKISIAKLGELSESNRDEFDDVLKRILFKSFNFKLKSSLEVYNQNEKVNTIVNGINKLNLPDYGRKIIEEIEEF